MTIGGLLFLLKMIMEKIPGFAAGLVSISGTGDTAGGSATGIASAIMGGLLKVAAGGAAKGLGYAARGGIEGAKRITSMTGVGSKWNKLGRALPFRGPRSHVRDMVIDSEIKKHVKSAKASGLSGKDLDKKVRFEVMHTMSSKKFRGKRAALGIRARQIQNRMDKQLVKEPLKKFLKKEAKLMVKHGKCGDEARSLLKEKARKKFDYIARSNPQLLNKYLGNLKGLTKVELSSKNAVKLISEGKMDKKKYLQHLKAKEVEREADKKKNPILNWLFRNNDNFKTLQNHTIRGLYHEGKLGWQGDRGRNDTFKDRHKIMNTSKGRKGGMKDGFHTAGTERVRFIDMIDNKHKYNVFRKREYLPIAKEYLSGRFGKDKQWIKSGSEQDKEKLNKWYKEEESRFKSDIGEFKTRSTLEKERKRREDLIKGQEKEYQKLIYSAMTKEEVKKFQEDGAKSLGERRLKLESKVGSEQDKEDKKRILDEIKEEVKSGEIKKVLADGKIEEAEAAINEMTDGIEDQALKDEIKEANEKLQAIDDDKGSLLEDLQGIKVGDSQAEEISNFRLERKNAFQRQKDALNSNMNSLRAKLDKRKRKFNSLKSKVKAISQEEKNEMQQLEYEIAVIGGHISVKEVRISNLSNEISILEQERY
jgi:hypothetical protein